MKKLILLLLFIPLVSFGQDYGNDSDALKLCTAIQTNSFISDSKADNALDRILSVIGASKRFVLQPCDNINNAVATSYKGIRYILYDKDFMDSLDSGDNWSNLFILAHEVGHHINGHSLDILLYAAEAVEPETLANQRQQELEADEFAGFILGKLGATLKQTSSSINLMSSEKDDTYDTHPSKSKRLASISTGYNKALRKETVVYQNPTYLQAAEEYFYSALNKEFQNDYKGAISDYTIAIELYPNNSKIYYNRGLIKAALKDYKGAIADYNKAIELNPDDAYAYHNRGTSKYNLNNNEGAIADFTKAIEIDPDDALNYVNRGKARTDSKYYEKALGDLSKAIALDPNYVDAYSIRGDTKRLLKDYYGAIADCNKAIELNPEYFYAYGTRGLIKDDLKDYYGAIADYTKAIEIEPSYEAGYINRSLVKEALGDINGSCADLRKVVSLGKKYANKATNWVNNDCNDRALKKFKRKFDKKIKQ